MRQTHNPLRSLDCPTHPPAARARMTTRFERVFAVACALLLTISMATAGVGFATAPAAAQSDTNGTATVSDTFEAYEVGTNNPGPWTAPSGSSGSAVVGDSFLGDRALEVTDSDGAAIYDGATVDSNDAAVQAVIRGTNAGGYIEYGGVTLEVNTGEFTNRLRLSDGTDETIVDGAAPTAGEWANVELIADGGDLEATIWPVGTDKPNSSDIELTGVDATGDLEVSTVNTDDVLTVDEVSVQPYSTLGSQTVSGTVTDQYDEPVPNATVQAIGVTQGALGGDDLEAEADALLDELSDPLPDAFNPDADLGDQYANADGTYAAVHPASAWNLGGVSLGSNAVSPAVTPSLDTPDVVLPADEQLIVSTWDAGDTGGALSQDGVDGSLPGATTADPVVIEQLGPTGETTHADGRPATTRRGDGARESRHEDPRGRGRRPPAGHLPRLSRGVLGDARGRCCRRARRTREHDRDGPSRRRRPADGPRRPRASVGVGG